MLEITKETRTVLRLNGRIDTTTAEQFGEAVEQALEGPGSIELDMGGVEYISSAGLRVLLKAQKTLSGKDARLILINPNEDVMNILRITGFDELLEIDRAP